MGGLIEHHGPLLPLQTIQMGAAVFLVLGQKALKGEPGSGQPGDGQSADEGAGAGHRLHRDVVLGTQGHQVLSGVGDGGGARIGDQGAALPGQQTIHNGGPRCGKIVAVVADHGLFQTQVVEQLHRHPGVLGGQKVRPCHGVRHTPGDVPQISNGGGNQIQFTAHDRSLLTFPAWPPPLPSWSGRFSFSSRPPL